MKAKVDEKLIEHVADVARLKISEKEKKQFVKELKEILDTFSKLDEVDTKGIDVSLQPVELKNVLREDKAKECLSQEEALSLTQNKKDGYFKGPRAI
ncbi:Asp-tRNA(Asn)/Glu-tRNA(Gln) amidotransferase subunit GatC [Candidatus Woesearchaeota archaeon]|nr:Asp-tRNA(Asn)/Glu-tRNA(Gln) amidotransferase subunit GatC [Candidatus Woesearchaeota archaeon]